MFLTNYQIIDLHLSFCCARSLRGMIELLPSGLAWQSTMISIPGYSTKCPLILYYQDPIECIKFTMKNPLLSGHIQYQPRQDFNSSSNHIYSNWITSDGTWDLQVSDPSLFHYELRFMMNVPEPTSTSCHSPQHDPVIGQNMNQCYDRQLTPYLSHPLLITLANIDPAFWSLVSSHAFSLLALFPVLKFVSVKKNLCGVLENWLTHACLDFITKPLKLASQHGVSLSDCAGKTHYCFTTLVTYIVDTPEATALTGVAGKTSHLTMATYKEFGDPFWHPPRTANSILKSLDILAEEFDPSQIAVYTNNTRTMFHLNGVHLPFWRNWFMPGGTLPTGCIEEFLKAENLF